MLILVGWQSWRWSFHPWATVTRWLQVPRNHISSIFSGSRTGQHSWWLDLVHPVARRSMQKTPIFHLLLWPPVHQRVLYKCCTLVYECLHGMGPFIPLRTPPRPGTGLQTWTTRAGQAMVASPANEYDERVGFGSAAQRLGMGSHLPYRPLIPFPLSKFL